MAPNGFFPMHISFRKLLKCMGNGTKWLLPHAFLFLEVSELHGERRKKVRTPCNLESGSFSFAWEWRPKAQTPCILELGSFLHAWEWRPKAQTPCKLESGSFLFAWEMAPKGKNPMQARVRKLLICMGNGAKRRESHAKSGWGRDYTRFWHAKEA